MSFSACSEYSELQSRWQLIEDLLGGTLEMREAREKWLPMEPEEESLRYEARLARSICFDIYKETVYDLAAQPFAREVSVTGSLPAGLEYFSKRVDRANTTLTAFASRLFYQALNWGGAYILVDAPATSPQSTLRDEIENRLQPYLVAIDARTVLDKSYAVDSTGLEYLSSITLRHGGPTLRSIAAEAETTEATEYIKVFSTDGKQCKVEVFSVTKDAENGTARTSTDSVVLEIPFIPITEIPFDEIEPKWPRPPLEGLAWLNLVHYQSMSDQRNILRIARAGLLLLRGLTEDDMKKKVVFGPNYVFKTKNEKADGMFIEYKGTSIQAGERDLRELEARMERLGVAPLLQRTARVAATSSTLNASRSESLMQKWVRQISTGLANAINQARYFLKSQPEATEFLVDIFKDFGVSPFSQAELTTIESARARGDLSHQAYLTELKRRSVLDERLDITKEVAAAQKESEKKAKASATTQSAV